MTMARRARAMVLSAAMALSAPAVAQEVSESHLQAARAAIEAIQGTEEFDSILPQAAQSMKSELIQQSPNLEDVISRTVDEEALALASRRADLEREAAIAYAGVFTEEELEQIAAFYQTSAGRKLIEEGPIVTREVYQAAEIWRRGVLRDLSNNVRDAMQEAAGEQAPVPGAEAEVEPPASPE